MSEDTGRVERAMQRLRAGERERRAAVEELQKLGVVRSHVLVGDLGEAIAARWYGVELAPPFTAGYDLIDRRGRQVQVRTLRATPERPRTIIGEIKRPCHVILAIRLNWDYTPTEAIEIPVDIAERYAGKNGKVSWTHALVAEERVPHFTGEELQRPQAAP